jgi:indolepyruvate ferredoxin oxidoreductase beta subunit
VAGLKSSPSRFIRIRDEVKADQTDLVKIFDFFKPGLPEIAGVLPSFLSRKLIAYAEKRAKSGLNPIAFPIKVRSHSISGFLLLRFVAGLKFLRPFGARFKDEQRVIDVWLKSIRVALNDNQSLAYEIARAGKLIKGYGETNERGKKNFLHILENVVPNIPSSESDAGKVVASLIEGALKDEGGVAFAKAVEGVGMAAPVPTIRPIRWFKKTDLKKQL